MSNPLRLVTKADQIIEAKPLGMATKPTGTRDRLAELAPKRPIEVVSHLLVRTERLALRPLAETDRDEFVRVLFASRDHLRGKVPIFAEPNEAPADAFERQLERTRVGDQRGTAWRRVAATPNGRIIGVVMLRNIERGLQSQAEITTWVAADAAKQGFASEIVDATLRFAFLDLPVGLGLHRITGAIRPDNTASDKLFASLGFERTGDDPERLEIDGEWIEHRRIAINASAFEVRDAG